MQQCNVASYRAVGVSYVKTISKAAPEFSSNIFGVTE